MLGNNFTKKLKLHSLFSLNNFKDTCMSTLVDCLCDDGETFPFDHRNKHIFGWLCAHGKSSVQRNLFDIQSCRDSLRRGD